MSSRDVQFRKLVQVRVMSIMDNLENKLKIGVKI